LSDDDPKKGVWLESARTLEYYLLRNGVRFITLIVSFCFNNDAEVTVYWLKHWPTAEFKLNSTY